MHKLACKLRWDRAINNNVVLLERREPYGEEVLYLVNRPVSRPSCDGAAEWMVLAIDRVSSVFKKVQLRGDTDFSLTHNFDRWDERVACLRVCALSSKTC
jgi:hypothetical protein